MVPSELKVEINQQQVKDFIELELSKQIHQSLLLVDINKLSEITCMSVRYLEDEILSDPRVKLHERRKNRKRWWFYEPTIEAIKNIVDEW